MVAENEEFSQRPAEEPAARLGSGVYVDVENLEGSHQQTKEAQEFIKYLLANWPKETPKPSRLTLYVRADQSKLWNIWAGSEFPEVATVSAEGVQHFSKNQSKNSADIAMAIDAITDIALGRVSCVVMVSDDSDFIPLYSKLRDEQHLLGYAHGDTPFLWVLTDRQGTKSDTIKEFFPDSYIRTLPFPKAEVNTSAETTGTQERARDSYEAMAIAVIEGIVVGPFRSADCWEIIRSGWSSHPIVTASESATAPESAFGERFLNSIFPILRRRGVENHQVRPRRYYMTELAKASLQG